MARKFIKRFSPSASTIKDHPSLQFLGTLLHDPNLFHLNRYSVSVAFFIGIFIAFIPMPAQMPLAAVVALVARCNLPISVALVWITNPFTTPVIFFFTYQLGRWLLGLPSLSEPLELSWEWLVSEFQLIWKPLLLGSLLCSLVFGALGYAGVRVFWRLHVLHGWNQRKEKRAKTAANSARLQPESLPQHKPDNS